MVHLRLEVNNWHGSWIVRRESHPVLEHSILVNALLAEVDTFPVRQLRCGVNVIRWHQVDANWCILLQELVL